MLFTDDTINNLHNRVLTELGEIPKINPKNKEGYFADIVEQIFGQQLSTFAADKIIGRIKENIGEFTPEIILKTPAEDLRALGSSNAKAQYVKNIADAFIKDELQFLEFDKYEDEKIIEEMVKIKGIGRWTAEMFLIFTMGRPDVFSVGDLALRRAVTNHYGYKKEPAQKTILKIAKKWSPNRSLASRILWRSLNLKN